MSDAKKLNLSCSTENDVFLRNCSRPENKIQIYCLSPNIYFMQIKHVINVFEKI